MTVDDYDATLTRKLLGATADYYGSVVTGLRELDLTPEQHDGTERR